MAKNNFFSRLITDWSMKLLRSLHGHSFFHNSSFGFSTFNDSGEAVSVERGSKISTVFTCMNTISQDIAKLPFNVIQDSAAGKTIQKRNIG